jgi:predicted nucleic acid-binding protein
MKVTCPSCKRRVRIRRGETLTCSCGQTLNYRSFFRKMYNYDVYLIDANVIIYALGSSDERGRACKEILRLKPGDIRIGVTKRVLDEVTGIGKKELPESLIVYQAGPLLAHLLTLRTNYLKQPSEADISMIQAAVQHPEIKGIITYDRDFERVAAQGMVEKRSSRKFWLGDANTFLKKYEVQKLKRQQPFPGGKK